MPNKSDKHEPYLEVSEQRSLFQLAIVDELCQRGDPRSHQCRVLAQTDLSCAPANVAARSGVPPSMQYQQPFSCPAETSAVQLACFACFPPTVQTQQLCLLAWLTLPGVRVADGSLAATLTAACLASLELGPHAAMRKARVQATLTMVPRLP